jgi:hypothetical protein
MSKGNTFENDLVKLIFNKVSITGIATAATGVANLYVSLHTADPGEAGNQTTSEVAYAPYARLSKARTTGVWAVTNNSVSPVANLDFAACTGGTTGVASHFAVGTAATGTGKILYKGAITPNISIAVGVTPRLTTASAITED